VVDIKIVPNPVKDTFTLAKLDKKMPADLEEGYLISGTEDSTAPVHYWSLVSRLIQGKVHSRLHQDLQYLPRLPGKNSLVLG
jgi:hypothetical protein